MASSVGAFGLALAAAHLRLLPERDPHARLYDALAGLLDALDRPARAAALMVRFELLLLDELGFGLDLASCAATGGEEELVYVSPKSGRAVSREAGQPYADRLLPLPAFLLDDTDIASEPASIEEGFLLTGYFFERHVFDARGEGLPEVRLSFLKSIRTAVDPAA
jgi:DNA repair protein RecO (recombination protein O)